MMIASLVTGLGLAVGHHIFYASLSGTTVSSTPIQMGTFSVSQQQFNIATGTALAFVAKASLVLAVSSAYTQLFFRLVRTQQSTLDRLDSCYSALNNLISLLATCTLYGQPLLPILALIAWYVTRTFEAGLWIR